ncbi:hypothetical protein THASP1DRAFT_22981 [Thamnocephalis sphaerospora]|uniref:RlpA-like double-psi beta-barrel-protein domain-containing protein-containing protein n=1 Tax=Thamnocephalis sphaerospora TaxID=78915 RepID=A0A4P9XSN2_9FUNG|nr:hypothetical protein THASP1DRAFT_22981 [Thamnocephalis sphaerospora]|eukprot:RKP09143.1 hypothetical protein THASP1DRAFT_22981 [Thamnocephalis sphaerospora]
MMLTSRCVAHKYAHPKRVHAIPEYFITASYSVIVPPSRAVSASLADQLDADDSEFRDGFALLAQSDQSPLYARLQASAAKPSPVASSSSPEPTKTGLITYFSPHDDACYKEHYTSSHSDMIGALNIDEFGGEFNGDTDRSSQCFRCAKIVGPKGTITVQITDMCPSK